MASSSRCEAAQPLCVAALVALFLLLFPGTSLSAGTTPARAPEMLPTSRPVVAIQRLDAAPVLENFLNMAPAGPAAQQMAVVTGFIQQEPEDGQPASQRTEVYLGYDDLNLYAVFVAFDDEPEKIRANMTRREQVFGDETVEIQLDTFLDERKAFSFLTNPFGIQWDAIWTEGQGFDSSWDTLWSSRGQLTDQGYVVWMAIPFKSLRFSPESLQQWGIVLVRDIPRNNETSFWPRVSSRIEGRLNQGATLVGLERISPGRNIQLIPYAAGRSFKVLDRREDVDPEFVKDQDLEAGLDAKMVFQDAWILDLTLNPDFSQVESDLPQVTVNQRFEVFFPERRPFFLENASLFETPFDLVFTRRIADPLAGARLTGKAGDNSVGAFVIDDEAPGELAPPDDPLRGERAVNGIFRYLRDIGRQSNLGALYTRRDLAGQSNEVGGIDGRIKLSDHWVAPFQVVGSRTRLEDGEELSGPAYSLVFNRDGRKFKSHIHYRDIAPDFHTDLGYVPRTDIRDAHASFRYDFRPEGDKLISWEPELSVLRIVDHEGTRLDWSVTPEIDWEFRRQTEFGFFARAGRERLRPKDFPELTEDADFSTNAAGFFFETAFIEPFYFAMNLAAGDGINYSPPEGEPPVAGQVLEGFAEMTLRPVDRLRIDTTYLYSRLDQPDGGDELFRDQILRLRLAWQFTRRITLRVIFQGNDLQADSSLTSLETTRDFNADILFTYLANPWTAVYVGYNTNYSNLALLENGGGTELIRTDGEYLNDAYQLFVKVSYLFRF